MKSRTSCYDRATGRMDLRRFGPAAILYIILLLLFLSADFEGVQGNTVQMIGRLEDTSRSTAILNFGYALVLAQLLFGDLYTPRLSYAIQALPVTRGSWFGTKVILGICASLFPNLLAAGYLSFVITEYRVIVLWWLASVQMQFLFFFGAAVLCAVCAGNRIGMVILYGIINFAAAFVIYLRTHLYASLICGMYIPASNTLLCPLVRMEESYPWVSSVQTIDAGIYSHEVGSGKYVIDNMELAPHFRELAIYAAVGCLAIWLALKLYHRRKAECAGDLLAFPKTEPVILVAATLCAGTVGNMAAYLFDLKMGYLLLFLGCIVGYYVCLMLLRRSVEVFTARSLMPIAAVCGVLLLSLVLTGLDVLGITYRAPKAEAVDSIRLYSSADHNSFAEITDPDKIEQILQAHQLILEEHRRIEAARFRSGSSAVKRIPTAGSPTPALWNTAPCSICTAS